MVVSAAVDTNTESQPSQTMDHMLVDAMTVRMTLHPESLDTILATNLHADILSDLAAGEPSALYMLHPRIGS
jgi:isocitrate/isopropylmalate dehydrogenase